MRLLALTSVTGPHRQVSISLGNVVQGVCEVGVDFARGLGEDQPGQVGTAAQVGG